MVLRDASQHRIPTIGRKADVFIMTGAASTASPIRTTPIGPACIEVSSTVLLENIHRAIGQRFLDPRHDHDALTPNALAENPVILARHERRRQAAEQVWLARSTLLCFSTPSGAVDLHLCWINPEPLDKVFNYALSITAIFE